MGVASDGSYGIPEGLISGFPCTCQGGEWAIVQGLDIDPFSREKIDASVAELIERARHCVRSGPDLSRRAASSAVALTAGLPVHNSTKQKGRGHKDHALMST